MFTLAHPSCFHKKFIKQNTISINERKETALKAFFSQEIVRFSGQLKICKAIRGMAKNGRFNRQTNK